MKNEEYFRGESYEVIAWAQDQEVVRYETFGDYEGEWLMVSKDSENYFVYKGSFGSDSYTDDFLTELYSSYAFDRITKKEGKKFAKKYKPFLVVPADVMRNVCAESKLFEILPANIRNYRVSDISEDSLKSFAKKVEKKVLKKFSAEKAQEALQ